MSLVKPANVIGHDPILGINKNLMGGWDYECVAVQGSWVRGERMLFGTPLSIVADAIMELLK
jgi:hypothetical protein